MKKYFKEEKPKKDQVIGFKSKISCFPEIGLFQKFNNGIEEVYIPALEKSKKLRDIDYWFETP